METLNLSVARGTLAAVLSRVVGLRSDHNGVQEDEQRYLRRSRVLVRYQGLSFGICI